MSFQQYKRLLVVLFVPLLVVGVVVSYLLFSKDNAVQLLCEPWFSGVGDNCRDLGGTPLYSVVHKKYPTWFDVYPAKDSKIISASIENSGRVLRGVTVLGVNSFGGYPDDVSRQIKGLIGKQGAIVLGIRDSSSRSIVLDSGNVLLYCNSLRFKEGNDFYQSYCFGEGWGADIYYSVLGEDRDALSALESSISEEIKRVEESIVIGWVVMTPMFVIIFVLISFVIYLVQKAYRYVKGGAI